MGKLADRFGILAPLALGAVCLCLGYGATALSTSLWQFALAHGLLIGLLGSSAAFGPLMADISLWFARRRGIAVSICARATTSPARSGRRWSSMRCRPMAGAPRRRDRAVLPRHHAAAGAADAPAPARRGGRAGGGAGGGTLGLPPNALQGLLVVAGLAAASPCRLPQVHIVAYCGDLGYGVARGAEMLSLMLGFGIVSRVASGFLADRIGGLRTLLVGSVLQGVALSVPRLRRADLDST